MLAIYQASSEMDVSSGISRRAKYAQNELDVLLHTRYRNEVEKLRGKLLSLLEKSDVSITVNSVAID